MEEEVRSFIDDRKAQAINPHWVGDYPAWDIVLTDGSIKKDITRREIQAELNKLLANGLIDMHNYHIDVVREMHIQYYNKSIMMGLQ